ncbi:helix-turn-helix domain-containing protein [Phyllobacterium sp. 22229]|uniref:HTH cro/C1-type domain-containing protein n=1 Tax=Phyllobacterium myrsinacearum TaxID=28101 RepID=A0A2S9J9M4_9HYPH|nr:helix-turn-helix transcriptional regulator [Phyllobacterium myrsinacearum]PRD49495.1 hypothetical protein C5750_25785 [Phyllobacterium myrsinacearum]PWV83503.1 helix-turn-helix protein [Phyllobacterium myrsinacearum]RZS70594.1 helix-turn-helix protein [Phyllobacterium myrsinacearum]RZU96761.1 helix-turn-helix protein [Phyllobacterium myrsinacearum]
MPKYSAPLEESVELGIFQLRLAASLATLRKRERFKLHELASRVGVSNTYMTRIMRGRANVSLGLLYALCRELDVPVTELIGTWADMTVDNPHSAATDGHSVAEGKKP